MTLSGVAQHSQALSKTTIDGITHTATTSSPVGIRGRMLLAEHGAGVAIFDMDTGRVLQEFSGTNGFEASSLSPDGRRVATYSSNANPDYVVAQLREEIRIWDSESGKLLLLVSSHAGSRIGWTPDSQAFYTSLWGGKTQLWETASGRELPPLPGIPRFRPDGREVAVSQPGTTSLLDYPSRTERCTLHAWIDRSLAFSPDGQKLAAVVRATLKPPPFDRSVGWEVRVWNSATCRELHSFPVSATTFSSVAFTPDGRSILVNLAKPASAAVLDAQTGIVTRIFIPAQAEFVTDALLSPDGEHLLTRQSFMDRQTFKGEQHFCSLWDVSSGQELHRWQEENFGVVNTCAGFSSDGQVVSIIAGNGIRSLWSAETGNLIRQFK